MSEWKECKLGEIAEIVDCEHKTAPIDPNGEYYSIRTSEIHNGKIDFDAANRVSKDTYKEWTQRAVPQDGDIILAREAPVGDVGWIGKEHKICLGQRTVLIRTSQNPRVHARFVLYYLVNNDAKQELMGQSVGSVVAHLNVKNIREFPIRLPHLSAQKAIAEVLGSLDDKIELLHQQNKTQEALAETLFRQWFVEGESCETRIMLGDVVQTTSGGTPSRTRQDYYENGTIRWVKSKELNGTFIFDTEETITEDAIRQSSAKMIPANSVVIAMYGATVGEYGILANPATCNQAVCALLPNEHYPYSYLFFFIKMNKELIKTLAVGSAQQNISQVLIKQLMISADKDAIQQFHYHSNPLLEKIRNNIEEINHITKLRDELLPKLMSGEIQVS